MSDNDFKKRHNMEPYMMRRANKRLIPEYMEVEKQLGDKGNTMIERLIDVVYCKYMAMPQHPISIRVEVLHRELFKKIIAMDKLRLLLKIMKWEYFETEKEFHFMKNKDTELFVSYNSQRIKSVSKKLAKSEDKKNNKETPHEENQQVTTLPKSQKPMQNDNLRPIENFSKTNINNLKPIENISTLSNRQESLNKFHREEYNATFPKSKLPKAQPSEIITSSKPNNFENSCLELKTSINKNITSGGAFKDCTIFAETPPPKISFENLAIKKNFETPQIIVNSADREFAKMALDYFLAKSDNPLAYKGIDANKWGQSIEALVRQGYDYTTIKDVIVYALQSPHWRKLIHEPKDLLAKTNSYTLGRMHYIISDMKNKTGKTEVTSESLAKAWEEDEIQKAKWEVENKAERDNGLDFSYYDNRYNTYEVN